MSGILENAYAIDESDIKDFETDARVQRVRETLARGEPLTREMAAAYQAAVLDLLLYDEPASEDYGRPICAPAAPAAIGTVMPPIVPTVGSGTRSDSSS